MKKIVNIVTIGTPPLVKNPYSIFLVDSLIKNYEIVYWSNIANEEYNSVTFRNIRNFWSVYLKKILGLIIWIYYIVKNRCVDKGSESKYIASYVSSTLINNLFLFIYLFFKTNRKQIFIVINADGLLALSWLKKFKKNKFAYCIYEVYPFQFFVKSKKMRDWRCFVERIGIKNCDMLIDTGENKISVFLQRIYKLHVKSICNLLVVPEKVQTLSRMTTEYPVRFYYHGFYGPNRGLENLIYSMKEIDVNKGLLYLRGIGDYQSELKQLVIEQGLQNKVFFLDPVATVDLSQVASHFDVGCTMVEMNIINHKFAIGFKTFENINAGLAIIAPDSFNLHPFLNKNGVGIMYKDSTVEELVRVLSYYIDDLENIDLCKRGSRYCADYVIGRNIQVEKLEKIIVTLDS